MRYIDLLKEQNISFSEISENEAEDIMISQYSYYKLMEFSELFDRYKYTENKGKFIHLDFSDLFNIAQIDNKLSQIMMFLCLEIERCTKTLLLNEVDSFIGTQQLVSAYYNSDKEYIDKTYTVDNIEVLEYLNYESKIENMQLHTFLNIVQFGTFERLVQYYCCHVLKSDDKTLIKKYEPYLYSVRRIRNIVAHNSSILNKLAISTEYKNQSIRAYLGRNGIKSKNLRTNMSKLIVCDMVNVLYLYFNLVPDNKCAMIMFKELDTMYCRRCVNGCFGNDQLNSLYLFLKSAVTIFVNTKQERKNN